MASFHGRKGSRELKGLEESRNTSPGRTVAPPFFPCGLESSVRKHLTTGEGPRNRGGGGMTAAVLGGKPAGKSA